MRIAYRLSHLAFILHPFSCRRRRRIEKVEGMVKWESADTP